MDNLGILVSIYVCMCSLYICVMMVTLLVVVYKRKLFEFAYEFMDKRDSTPIFWFGVVNRNSNNNE